MLNLADKFKQFSAGELKTQPITTGGSVLLVDGLNTYLRAFAATPTMDDDGEHIGGITGFLLSVGATIRMFKPSRVFIVWDGANGSQRRRAMFKDYKSNRRHMTKLNRTYDFASIEDEQKSMKWQWGLLIQILRNLPVTVIAQDNVEADDVIAYLAQIVDERDGKAIIVSTDKDFLQLVNDNIVVWNPIKKKMYNPERVVEDYGFHPNNFLLYRAVTGDNSDCIPGVKGIKEKTLLKYFPELSEETPRDIDFLFEVAENIMLEKKKPPVALKTLVESKDQLKLNYSLMRLDDVAMSGHTRGTILRYFESEPNSYNKAQLTKLLRYNKLIGALGNYETWLQTTFVPLLRYKLNG